MANLGVTIILLVFIGGFCAHATSPDIINPVDTVFKIGEERTKILNCTVTPAENVKTLEWTFGNETICDKDNCTNTMYDIEKFDLFASKTTFDIAGLYTCSFVTTTKGETTDASTTANTATDAATTDAATDASTTANTATDAATTANTATDAATTDATTDAATTDATTDAATTDATTDAATTDATTDTATTDATTDTATANALFNEEDTFAQNDNHNYSAEVNIIGAITCPEAITMKYYETKKVTCSVDYAGNTIPTLHLTRTPEKTYFRGREAVFRHKRSEETKQESPLSEELNFDKETVGTYEVSCKVTYPNDLYEDACSTITVTVENAAPSVTPGLGLILATLLATFYQRLM